jgi:geranylgeranyl pyrophosphate synthase
VSATLDLRSAPAPLRTWLAAAASDIDRDLDGRLTIPADDPGRLIEAMRYAALGPGKRLRPALVLAAAEAVGGARVAAMPAAAALELLHAYTLVHDDLPSMDDDDERRGRPTVHVAFGEATALLAGDGLHTLAFGALAELGPRAGDAVRVLAQRAGARELLRGQAIDLQVARAGATPTPAQLAAMHAGKTGALFAAACELGAIAGGATPATVAMLGAYGMAVGIAFQHADDRDDGEFVDHAAAAAAEMKALCARAGELVAGLGPSASVLSSLAAWIGSRA